MKKIYSSPLTIANGDVTSETRGNGSQSSENPPVELIRHGAGSSFGL